MNANFIGNILYPDRFYKLDLHGYDRETARVAILDFIRDAKKMKEEFVVIIHGNGSGIIKKITYDTLKKSPDVVEYGISYFNQGMTIVRLKKGVIYEDNN